MAWWKLAVGVVHVAVEASSNVEYLIGGPMSQSGVWRRTPPEPPAPTLLPRSQGPATHRLVHSLCNDRNPSFPSSLKVLWSAVSVLPHVSHYATCITSEGRQLLEQPRQRLGSASRTLRLTTLMKGRHFTRKVKYAKGRSCLWCVCT